MALEYDNKNIEIKFFANKNMDEGFKKELIVYPVLAYKIYAPVIDDLQLNIFQKYILSILNKGKFSFEEIAKWLSLDLLLVKTIAAELANKDLIDINTLFITKKGKQLAEGTFSWFNSAADLRKDIRYVFQDIFTEELYPVILPFDNFQTNVYLKEKQLHINSKGRKDKFDYKLIEPKDINFISIRKPEITAILTAIDEQAKMYLPNSNNDIKEMPDAVHFLDEEPDVVFCAIWIYVDKNNIQEDNINISDPFNIYDEAYWLRDNILKAKEQNRDLGDVVHNLIYTIEDEESNKASEFILKFKKDIEKELNNTFDFTLKVNYKNLYDAIKEYYFDIKFYEIDKDASNLKNAFRKSQIVMETLLKTIFNDYNEDYGSVIVEQTKNGGRFSAYKDEVIAKVKTINNNIKIPNWYHGEFKNVYYALKNPDKASLRALYIATILAAYYNNKNPFFRILQQSDDILTCIENIADRRNKVGHKHVDIASNEVDQYYSDALKMKNNIERIIQLFLKN